MRIAGVRFDRNGPLAFYDAGPLALRPGDLVRVPTAAGPRVGQVVVAPDQVLEAELLRADLARVLGPAPPDEAPPELRPPEPSPGVRALLERMGVPPLAAAER